MNVKEELLDIVSEFTGIPVGEISTSEGFKLSCGLNSFMLFSMVSTIEEHFGISIPNSALMKFQTLDDIIAYVENALKG